MAELEGRASGETRLKVLMNIYDDDVDGEDDNGKSGYKVFIIYHGH